MALFPKIVGRNLHEVGYLRLSAAPRVSTMDSKYGRQFADQDEHFCCVRLFLVMYSGGNEVPASFCSAGREMLFGYGAE